MLVDRRVSNVTAENVYSDIDGNVTTAGVDDNRKSWLPYEETSALE